MAQLTRCPNKTDCGYYTVEGDVARHVQVFYTRGVKTGQPKTVIRGGKEVPVTELKTAHYHVRPRGSFRKISLSNDIELSFDYGEVTLVSCPCCGTVFNKDAQTESFRDILPDSWNKKTSDIVERIVEANGY